MGGTSVGDFDGLFVDFDGVAFAVAFYCGDDTCVTESDDDYGETC
jgi:hypothetical protein